MEEMENLNFFDNTNKFVLDLDNSSNAKIFDEIENCLIGSFDKNGKYVISDELGKELIALKKIYLYAFGEAIFCESEKEFATLKNIQFLVKVQEKDKKNMVAKLYITQDVKRANGYIKKTAITEIATYENINSPSFVNDCFEKFNIHSKSEDGFQLKDKTESDPVLVLKREKLLADKKVKLDKEDEKFKILLEKKLQLLAKYKFGKSIVNQYNAELAKAKAKFGPGQKGYYRHLNSILDKIINENKERLLNEPVFVSQWGKLNSKFNEQMVLLLAEEVKKPKEENKVEEKPKLEKESKKMGGGGPKEKPKGKPEKYTPVGTVPLKINKPVKEKIVGYEKIGDLGEKLEGDDFIDDEVKLSNTDYVVDKEKDSLKDRVVIVDEEEVVEESKTGSITGRKEEKKNAFYVPEEHNKLNVEEEMIIK